MHETPEVDLLAEVFNHKQGEPHETPEVDLLAEEFNHKQGEGARNT